MTPYDENSAPDDFYNGVTFMLEPVGNTEKWITDSLEMMTSVYNINTINIYGLESFIKTNRSASDLLFSELKRLDMRVVVRIEYYDSQTFSFSAGDLDIVMAHHDELIEYVSAEERRGQVAYFALNMPVDDGNVQGNLGGTNSPAYIDSQIPYAEDFVSRMRAATASYGFTDSKMFLSVFYGWDNGFKTPSYVTAGADGYFINNYTYPATKELPDINADTDTIINANRLNISMKTFVKQYGNDAPYVIECGFHTLEYNNGVMPAQTAGLVRDAAVKEIAMKAALNFYKEKYPNIRGMLYFGYNLYKEEGHPPAIMDWTLLYPSGGGFGTSSLLPGGNAEFADDEQALSGAAIYMTTIGDEAKLSGAPMTQMAVLRYKSVGGATIGLYSSGRLKKTVTVPASADYTEYGIPLVLVEGYDLSVRLEENADFTIDTVYLYPNLEAEFGIGADITVDDGASLGYTAKLPVTEENAVHFAQTRGGEKMLLSVKSENGGNVCVAADGIKYNKEVSAGSEYVEIELDIPLASDESFDIYAESGDIYLDTVTLSGAPVNTPRQSAATMPPSEQPLEQLTEQPTEQPTEQSARQSGNPIIIPIIVTGIAVIFAAAVVITLKLRAKK